MAKYILKIKEGKARLQKQMRKYKKYYAYRKNKRRKNIFIKYLYIIMFSMLAYLILSLTVYNNYNIEETIIRLVQFVIGVTIIYIA